MPSCIWELDRHRDVPRQMWFLPPSVLCHDFLSLTSVFAPSFTFTASLCLSCQLHLLLPSVFVLLFLIALGICATSYMHFWPFFLSQFNLLQHSVFMPPGSKFIAAHGVCTFVPPVWFITALSLCTASLNHCSTAIVLYFCLGICTAIFICLHPFSCIDAHIFLWVSFIDALSIFTASLNSLLPLRFVPPVGIHCTAASNFALVLFFVTAFRFFCGQFYMLLPSVLATPILFISAFSLLCHPFHWLLPLAFALCIPLIIMLPVSYLRFWLQFATGSLNIINFWLFACKHSCCAITIDSRWWWVLTSAKVSIVSVTFNSFELSLDFNFFLIVLNSKFHCIVHGILTHFCMYP